MTDLAGLLGFARELAELGGRIAQSHYGGALERKLKGDGTWATEADWKAEAQIRLRIARSFPKHNILGEEDGLTAAGGEAPNEGAPTWVVDPIDGTLNFMAGIPIWATLVGLQVEGRMEVGVAHAPVLGETYDAATGLGARMNGRSITSHDIKSLDEATVVFSGGGHFDKEEGPFMRALVAGASRSRGFGDFWGHMLVARGAAHVMVEPDLNEWDILPLLPILSEAGARCTRFDGTAITEGAGSCVTTCPSLHQRVLELARGTLHLDD